VIHPGLLRARRQRIPRPRQAPEVFLTYSAGPGNKGFADIRIRESLRRRDRPGSW